MTKKFKDLNRSSPHKVERYLKRFDKALLYLVFGYILILTLTTITLLIIK